MEESGIIVSPPYTMRMEEEENADLPILKIAKNQKANVIRIFNAMHRLKLIETIDGDIPSKLELMRLMGNFFGEDLTDYAQTLNLAKKSTEETYLKIFDSLKDTAEKQWSESNKI